VLGFGEGRGRPAALQRARAVTDLRRQKARVRAFGATCPTLTSRSLRSTLSASFVANPPELPIVPEDVARFAEAQVAAGRFESVGDVLRSAVEALEREKLVALRDALDLGIAELDAGQGVRTSPKALMDEVRNELGLDE